MSNLRSSSSLLTSRKHRLWLAGIGVIVFLILSVVTAYYWHTTAPIIPLAIILLGAMPIGIIVDELRKLPRTKKAQKTSYPPKRSS